MSKTENRLTNIIWAFDALEDRAALQLNVARVLNAFQAKAFVQIEPVFVLVAPSLGQQVDPTADWMQSIRDKVRKQMEDVLIQTGFPYVLAPRILIEPIASTAASVQNLLSYADQQRADVIVVSSHGRRGLDRFFLGSFAETLLSHSTCPVLVVGGGEQVDSYLSRILYPTDFSDRSRVLFGRAVAFAHQMSAKMRLFHSIPVPSRSVMDTGFYPAMYGVEGEMVTYEDFMQIQFERQMRRAESWAEWAKSQGVPCDFKVDTSGKELVDLIENEIRESQSDVVVMEGKGGPIRVAILGSTTRAVVRQAGCPVLVFPRQDLEASTYLEGPHERGHRAEI